MLTARFLQACFALTTGLFGAYALSSVGHAQSSTPQRQPPMMFFDQRRLPDMEVERRNQEVLVEQRRVEEQRRAEAEAAERNKATASRLAAEAQREAQRKIDEAGQLAEAAAAKNNAERKADEDRKASAAADSDAKRKAEEIRLATEAKRKADEARLAAEAKRKADEDKQVAADAEAEAKRKADTDKQVAAAAEAETKRKAEEARLAAEAKRKADEDKQVAAAAEAETKRKAEEARLAAGAKRKADEDKQVAAAAEAETKRKAEEARQLAVATEAKRAAELAKLAAEATEARRKADEARLAATAAAGADVGVTPVKPANQTAALIAPVAPPAVAPQVVKPAANAPSSGCPAPKTGVTSLPAGRMQLAIQSACRVNEPVTIAYGELNLVRKLDAAGSATVTLDQIFGPGEGVTLRFVDGATVQLSPTPLPPSAYPTSKVAIIWEKNVDLNLHAFEAGATIGKPGHIWSGGNALPQSVDAIIADAGRGAGWISTVDDGRNEGSKMEVYTFLHSPEQLTGVVALAIEHASRGSMPPADMCGSAALAEIPFDVIMIDNKGQVLRESGIVPAVACGQAIGENVRYLRGAVPDLRIRR
jgi:hypothetical protein